MATRPDSCINRLCRKTKLIHSIALYSMYYNFAPIYQTLRITPDGSGGERLCVAFGGNY